MAIAQQIVDPGGIDQVTGFAFCLGLQEILQFNKAAGFRRTGRRERAYPDAQTRQLASLIVGLDPLYQLLCLRLSGRLADPPVLQRQREELFRL